MALANQKHVASRAIGVEPIDFLKLELKAEFTQLGLQASVPDASTGIRPILFRGHKNCDLHPYSSSMRVEEWAALGTRIGDCWSLRAVM